jgi:carbamoyl-phosphate synthase large subunit
MSLFERVANACRQEGVEGRFFSYEDTQMVPVAALSTVLEGVRWDDAAFEEHLLSVIQEHRIDVIIPCMDGATVSLARAATAVRQAGAWAVVSGEALCAVFNNKRLAERWFLERGVTTPVWRSESPFPCIIKHIHGFGSRRQFIARTAGELQQFTSQVDLNDYLIQPFVEGPEFTVDAYVSRAGDTLGCVSRRRIRVVDGEVVECVIERHDELLGEVARILRLGEFRGPITFQAIRDADKFWFVEGNLRFGGGVILSIEAGADYARLLVREALGRPVAPVSWREGLTMTRAHREVFHLGRRSWL